MTDDGKGSVCGYADTTTDSPCERPVSDADDHCYMHPPDGGELPAGHGAPEGNDHAVANDGGAPRENGNAVDHGMLSALKRKRDILIEEHGEWAAQYLIEREREYRQKCANPSRAHRLAVKQTLAEVMDERVIRGGSPAVIEAQNALEREVRIGLAYEGVRTRPPSSSRNSKHDNLNLLVGGDD